MACRGELVGFAVHVSDDDGFVEKHLELVSTIRYEQAGLEVEHVVWAFPDAPGLRTQLRVRALPGFHPEGKPAGANGTAALSLSDIDAEISAARRARRRK